MSGDLPLYEKLELRAMTNSTLVRESAVMISSTMPSAKYSCSGSPLMFWNGSTAMDERAIGARHGVVEPAEVEPGVGERPQAIPGQRVVRAEIERFQVVGHRGLAQAAVVARSAANEVGEERIGVQGEGALGGMFR